MRSDVDAIKERLDIAEIVSSYTKLEKAGQSFKGRCPFHNEKTPSFFVSPLRQSYYCFGCGEKGDIFTFVERMEGLEFRDALKLLADKAGIEIQQGNHPELKEEREKLFEILEAATLFFEKELKDNTPALKYLSGRGLELESIKRWRIGYAPSSTGDDWRALYHFLKSSGYQSALLLKAGLVKVKDNNREPYDTFRDRLTFPLSDASGRIIAFSGRALSKDTEPKYLNSPDTVLFNKSEVLYGFHLAKQSIRKLNYSVLVEGQMDLVLSHQAGVSNAVATSGTAVTNLHLDRLKHLSNRIIIGFDGDDSGRSAAEKVTHLAMSMGFEVKIADLPEGADPASVTQADPAKWKEILRQSLPAVEYFLNKLVKSEDDPRKLGQQIGQKILPMIKLIESAIEQSHFISLIARKTGIKEEVLLEDLKKVRHDSLQNSHASPSLAGLQRDSNSAMESASRAQSRREQFEERLLEVERWLKELPEGTPEVLNFKREKSELSANIMALNLTDKLALLLKGLEEAESVKDRNLIESLTKEIQSVHSEIRALEEKKKIL